MFLKKKILIGIVTYNRCKLLQRCISAIIPQIQDINLKADLLIINNSSTDDTVKFLNENKIKYITMENKGPVYGWEKLINTSIDKKYDYLWLMDDDGYPEKNSLKILSSFAENNKFSIINSLVLNELNHNELSFPMPILNKEGFPSLLKFPRKIKYKKNLNNFSNKNLYPFCHLFNGSFFSVEALKKSGNVNTNFKIYGEELDLFYKLKKIGPCFTLLNSFHYHPKFSKTKINTFRAGQWLNNSLRINYQYMNNYRVRNFLLILKFIYFFGFRSNFLKNYNHIFKAILKLAKNDY